MTSHVHPTDTKLHDRLRRHENWMRVVYALTLLAAGITGLMVLLMPATSEAYLLLDNTDRLTSGLAGAAWLAMGLTALFGLMRPWHFSSLFFYLTMFHGSFLGAIGIPLWAAGVDWIMPHVVMSSISFLLAITAAPWKQLFARDQHAAYLADEDLAQHDGVHVHHHHATATTSSAPWRQRDADAEHTVRTGEDRDARTLTTASPGATGHYAGGHTQHMDERLDAGREPLHGNDRDTGRTGVLTSNFRDRDDATLHRADVEDDALRRQLEAARAEEGRRQQALNEARRLREDYESRLRDGGHRRAA